MTGKRYETDDDVIFRTKHVKLKSMGKYNKRCLLQYGYAEHVQTCHIFHRQSFIVLSLCFLCEAQNFSATPRSSAFGSANPFSKSPRNRKKCKVTPGRLICEFTTVDDNSLLIELLCMPCIIYSVGFSLRLLKGSYLFPKYSKNFVNPFGDLLESFERNHRVTRRRLNSLFRLIFGQYSNFRGSQCVPRGYMDTRMTCL